ncbi:MAG: hypothetical protein P4L27_11665 [Ignavibacteriaceae bacterium]|nr:hypothetical protein [Ignavibacteriaceae bacterium]
MEVIYWDGKILDVRDVSCESPEYFEDQLKISVLNKYIKESGLHLMFQNNDCTTSKPRLHKK